MQDLDRIIDTLNSIRTLPTLPVVMQKIQSAVRDPNADATSIAHLIEDDPAVMTRLLKVVNSSLYGGTVEIESVQQAVARLGMNATANIALSTSVLAAFGDASGEGGFDRTAFWRHSISVGIAATVVATHAADSLRVRHSKEQLRLVGLLHDVGKLIMDQYMAQDFSSALDRCRSESIPLYLAEREAVGVDHASLGGWLCGKWNLAQDLMLAILWHHEPDSAPEANWELAALCHVANYICNREHIGDGGDLAAPACEITIWKRLGLSISDISGIVDEINEAAQQSDILMALG